MPRLLLDTHILLWWLSDDHRLKDPARGLVADPNNLVFVSAASAWEIAIKQALGKLTFEGEVESTVRAAGFSLLPICFAHAAETRNLPPIHQDPFDRILVAQARLEGLCLVSTDARIRQYPIPVVG